MFTRFKLNFTCFNLNENGVVLILPLLNLFTFVFGCEVMSILFKKCSISYLSIIGWIYLLIRIIISGFGDLPPLAAAATFVRAKQS